jgi:hypothetical protein
MPEASIRSVLCRSSVWDTEPRWVRDDYLGGIFGLPQLAADVVEVFHFLLNFSKQLHEVGDVMLVNLQLSLLVLLPLFVAYLEEVENRR